MGESSSLKWWSSPSTLLRHILMLDDTPHSIALGTTVGMFIGMTPTVGIQMILVMLFGLLVKRLFSFNRVAALITVYLSNPLTMVPIYYFNYWVGTFFVGGSVTRDEFAAILHYDGFAEWRETIVALFVDVGWPLIVGSLVVASVCAAITYPAMHWLLDWFHRPKLRGKNSAKEGVPAVETAERVSDE